MNEFYVELTLIKWFTKDDTYPRPEWVKRASNFFLCLFSVLLIYQTGVYFDFIQGITYSPQLSLIENISLNQLIILLASCAVFVNIFWILFSVAQIGTKWVLNVLNQTNRLISLMALLHP